jgi:hypothetical protein
MECGGDLFQLGSGGLGELPVEGDINAQLTRIFVAVCGGGAAIFAVFRVGVRSTLSGGRRITGTMCAYFEGAATFLLNAPHICLQTGDAAEKEYHHESKGDNMSNRYSIHGAYISNLTISCNNQWRQASDERIKYGRNKNGNCGTHQNKKCCGSEWIDSGEFLRLSG